MARPTIIIGPKVSDMTREAATQALEAHPRVANGAEFDIQQHAGHWIAAIVSKEEPVKEKASKKKTAAPPFGDDEGGGEVSGPPSDDSSDSAPPSDDDSSEDEESPPKKKKGGDDALLHQLMEAVQAIATALGVPVGAGGPPGLGPDVGGPPGLGPDSGPPPPPHGGPGGPAGGKPPLPHERPGPPPPATFASVDPKHPWAHTIGQVPHFTVAEKLGNSERYEDIEHELQTIARAGGFRVARFTPLVGQQGERAVQAVIETPRS